ncbi:MAG: NAD-dependent epimerase/dehydratase family protein [Candidatus Bathyarchaeia archaeon]
MKKILVIGATGQIGSELTLELRKRFGGENVVAAGHRKKPGEKILNSGSFVYLDATNKEALERVVEEYDIDTVYHLAAVLSAAGEENPQKAWRVNMESLYNVLEVAREKGLTRVFWPSSIAVFGPEAPMVNTPQNAVLTPRTIYGVSKAAGELLCSYYFHHYGIDVRSVRYPGIISIEKPSGMGTTDYAVEIFYEAIRRKRYTCYLKADRVLPMMYMPDCINAALKLMEADPSRIKCRTSYNVAAMSFSPAELVAEIRKYIPDFICEYKPDFRQKIAESWPMTIDDGAAREDWGWEPQYDLAAMVKDMIEKLSRRFAGGKL